MEMRTEVPWLHVPWTRIYYYGGTGQVSSMEMERHQLQLQGTLRIHRVTTQLGGLRQWRMQKDLGHLLPGCGTSAHVYCPVMRGKVGNGANGRGNDSRKDIQ